jgi:hypothetical protein
MCADEDARDAFGPLSSDLGETPIGGREAGLASAAYIAEGQPC